MKITIKLTAHEASHLSDHMFMDECDEACKVLYKVQAAIRKQRKAGLIDRLAAKAAAKMASRITW